MKRILLLLATALVLPSPAFAQGKRELQVHLAQANNDSPYAFVRARFNPGELADPWAVRFFDDKGAEVPYFVWDSVTWKTARDGRTDWGNRYALLNHGAGDFVEATEARGKKLDAAKDKLPALAAKLEAQEQAEKKAPDSVCAALYLLKHKVAPLGKERLTLRLYPKPQVEPRHQLVKGPKGDKAPGVAQGGLEFRGLPDKLAVAWKGTELFRSGGFKAGAWNDSASHADAERPFTVETWEGIVTKVTVTGQTRGRKDGTMDWQCCYWLFPEGGFVGLEGFSLSDTTDYLGGPQTLSIWQADGAFTQARGPRWETPWWLHQAGDRGFVATHLFYATPLTIGFGNNPFAVNTEGQGKDPKIDANDNRLSLAWSHRVDDPAISRLMGPIPFKKGGPPPKDLSKPGKWQPKVDWLYRQYAAGVGDKGPAAESALRTVLGAAAGWIDRPVSEEEVATLLVAMMPAIATGHESSEINLLKVVPAILASDKAATREALGRIKDQSARTDFYIGMIREHVKRGGKASEGKKPDDKDGTPREGWTGNACYHAALMPTYIRVLEHFEQPFPRERWNDAVLHFADFTLDLLGGTPTDFDKLDAALQTEWPSRVVPTIPLLLHAYSLKADAKYTRPTKMLFDDLMKLVERNPHGYFPAWTFNPKADKYDTVYDPVSFERGLCAFWWEGQLDLIGRDRASKFVAAQARWLVFSGQLLDSLETDNPTGIRASTHGAHTNVRNQIGVYLYDDFAFYRGLIAALVDWSAASSQVAGEHLPLGTSPYRGLELSNAGSAMLRWALGIRPGSKAVESKVEKLGEKKFRIQIWSRLTSAKAVVKVTGKDLGLKDESEVLTVTLPQPAYREPVEIELTWTADVVAVEVEKVVVIKLAYRVLQPKWTDKSKLELWRRGEQWPEELGVTLYNDAFEWTTRRGRFELRNK
jgi:hypothetical protein